MTTLRARWTSSLLPAVVVPAAVGAALATEVRGRLERTKYARYGLLDRGSYDFLDDPDEPELLEVLAGLASEVTGREVRPRASRALRLGAGDYLLVRHDRVHDDRPIELVLDLSPAMVPGAEVHWRHRGQVFFTMPSSPGALAIVERGPTVMSNHTYVSKAHQDVSVVRLVVLLG